MSAGGGGFGPPTQRDPQLVLDDFLDDYVSLDAAENIYKVIIKDEKLDVEATTKLRNEIIE